MSRCIGPITACALRKMHNQLGFATNFDSDTQWYEGLSSCFVGFGDDGDFVDAMQRCATAILNCPYIKKK
jgi:hypothetical protein